MLEDIQQILHPTDFSDPAQNAFTYAMEIAHRSDAKLLVLHSAKPSYVYGSDKMMEEVIGRNKYDDLYIETTIDFGETVPNIIEQAGDLIVMGATGKTNMTKVLFGSTSSEIMLKSPVPVLIVPSEQGYSDFSRFIFATNYHDSDLERLQQLSHFAQMFNAEIIVLHVASKDNLENHIKFRGFREMVKETIHDSDINFRLIFDENFYTGLSAFLHDQNHELIVMTRHKKSFFKSLAEEDHIQKTMSSTIPLLVLPAEETLKETAETQSE